MGHARSATRSLLKPTKAFKTFQPPSSVVLATPGGPRRVNYAAASSVLVTASCRGMPMAWYASMASES